MKSDELLRFVGRKNTFAMQLDNGGYVPVRRTLTEQDLKDHLAGKNTYGSYVIQENGKVKFACIDIDCEIKFLGSYESLAYSIFGLFTDFERYLEPSGRRGYHIWLMLKEEESPTFIKELVKSRLKLLGVNNIEIYPKQDSNTGKGLGSLVKLPCGIHKKSGKWSTIAVHKQVGEK